MTIVYGPVSSGPPSPRDGDGLYMYMDVYKIIQVCVCIYISFVHIYIYIYTQYVSAYLYPVDVVGVWGQLFPTLSQPNLSGNEASKTHFLVRLSL